MDGLACSLVRASVLRACAVRIRGLGMAACLMCGAERPRAVFSAAGYAVFVNIGACAPRFTRVCVVRHVRCMVVCLMCSAVRSEFKLKLMSRILRGYAYGTTVGMCSPSGGPLYVCACMCACTVVGMCSPSGVPIVVSTRMRKCTAFGMHGPSTDRVLVAQKCACVYLHSARRVSSEWCTYRV